MVIQFDGATWEVSRDPDSAVWIGVCRELRLNAAGETYEELLEGIDDAMQLFSRVRKRLTLRRLRFA